MVEEKLAPLQILNGWKEVANFLGKGVRTVQRYERDLGLPIHRPAGKSRGLVIATRRELSAWVTSGQEPSAKSWLTERSNKLGAQFLLVDCEIALTFSRIAMETSNHERSRSLTRNARKGYDTIQQLKVNIDLSHAE